ncbi:MAG: hypothetical protein CML43_11760 [Rhodobacteraceae bacterium]|nr:hypothetical protein [Paracoccaceae bacterium]
MEIDNLGKSGVYIIINHITEDYYIGSAISSNKKSNRLYIRFRNHFLHSHKKTSINLRKAMLEYGVENFSFNIIAYTNPKNTRKIETQMIKKYKPKYNILLLELDSETNNHINKDQKINCNTLVEAENTSVDIDYKKSLNTLKFLSSRKTGVYDSTTSKLIKVYSSAKEVSKNYPVSYRTIRRYIKSSEPIKKLNIIIKYIA